MKPSYSRNQTPFTDLTEPSGEVEEVMGERVVMISTLFSVSGFGRPSWAGVDGGLTGLHILHLGNPVHNWTCASGNLGSCTIRLSRYKIRFTTSHTCYTVTQLRVPARPG